MPTTCEIREMLGEEKCGLLTAIYDYFIEHGEWIPERELHKRRGGKRKVRQALQDVGGQAVYLSEETSTSIRRYELTLLGMLLTQYGEEFEDLLANYLSFAKERAIEDPKLTDISSLEVAKDMNLDQKHIMKLGRLLDRGYQFGTGGSSTSGGWSYGLPKNIEDIPKDTKKYVRTVIGEEFDPKVPIDPKERQATLAGRTGLEIDIMDTEKERGDSAGRRAAATSVMDEVMEGSPDTFRAIMESLRNRLGGVWTASNGEELEFSEKRRIITNYDTDGGLVGRIIGTRKEDRTPSSRASWIVTSSRKPTEEELQMKRGEFQEEMGVSEEKVQMFLKRIKRVGGIEVYETRLNQIRIEFLDGYEPYAENSAGLTLPIEESFKEFARLVSDELPQPSLNGQRRPTSWIHDSIEAEIEKTPFLDGEDIAAAHRMADLYAILHCYENSVRRFIGTILEREMGTGWWTRVASKKMQEIVRERKEKEKQEKWLSPRGIQSPLYYLEWGDLEKIIRKKDELFLSHIGSIRFIESRFGDLEVLRNIVAHNGVLPSSNDFNRVLIAFQDWRKQISDVEEKMALDKKE